MATNTVTFDRAAMDQLDAMFGKHTKELQALARSMSQQVNGRGTMGLPGLRNGGDTLEDARKELESFLAIMRNNNKTLTATEKYNRNAAKRELAAIEEKIKAEKKAKDATDDNSDAVDENTDAQADNTDKVRRASGRLADFAEKVVGGTLSFTAMARAINEFSQAYKQGFNWNAMSDTVNAALQMGMSPKDMMDFQKRFRRVSNTLDGGITEFNETVAKSNVEWLHYTGSLRDAAMAQGEFYDLALSMGIGAKDMKGAVGGMFAEFKKLQVATSMTAEEFVATQKSLLAEKIVRDKLVGLQGKERTNYMLKLTDTAYMFQTLGLQKEAAESLVKALEQQSAKTGVTRLTEGAQMQAVAGILGMGQNGSRVRELAVKRNRTEDENKEFTSLMSEMSKRIETRKNGSLIGEIQMNALEKTFAGAMESINTLGNPVALASGAQASDNTLEKQRMDLAVRDSDTYGVIKENIVRIADILGGWSQSALAALLAVGVGKGVLSAGSAWLQRRAGGPPGPNPPPGPPGPGPGPGPNPPPGPNRWLAGATAIAKTGMYAAIIGTAASAAVGAFVQDEQVKSVVDAGITGASLGATVGALGGPIGIAIGGALGGIGGVVVGMVNNQEDMSSGLDKQKRQLIEQTSLDQRRFEMAQRAYEREIKQLEEKGKLSDEEQKRVDALKANMKAAEENHNATQAKVSAADTGYTLGKQADANDWMNKAAKTTTGGTWWGGDTSVKDTNAMISQMAGKLKGAGLNLSEAEIRTQFGEILGKMSTAEALGSEKQNALLDAQNSIMTGTGDFNTTLANPMIAKALQEYQNQVNAGFSATNQASFNAKFNTPEAITGLAEQVKAASDQISKDKAELARTQATSIFDETGMSGAAAAKIQERIDNSEKTLSALQQLVANSGQVTFKSEDQLVEVLQQLADNMKRGTGPGPIHK